MSLREEVANSPRVGDELVMHGARISYVVTMALGYSTEDAKDQTIGVTREGWVKNPESGAWEPCRTRFLEVPLPVWRDLVDLSATVSRDPLLLFCPESPRSPRPASGPTRTNRPQAVRKETSRSHECQAD